MNAEDQERSVELVKASLEHSQACVTHIDTKVGVAVGLLVFLLPAPLVAIGWLSGLQGDVAVWVLKGFTSSPVSSAFTLIALMLGMIFAGVALVFGMVSLIPRPPNGFDKSDLPGQNEWQPNVLFPIFKATQAKVAFKHFHQLLNGADFAFFIGEYEHQMMQFGSILSAKVAAMKRCFRFLTATVLAYAVAIAIVVWTMTAHLLAE